MRVRVLCLTLGMPILGVACGDDTTTKMPDARMIDAPKMIDAPETPEFLGFKAPEGGEVRMEYINFPNGNASLRTIAFNFKTAGSKPFFPLVPFNACVDADKAQGLWPTAQNPVEERIYQDPGLILISGGPATYTGRRNAAAGTDGIGRNHPAGQYTFT